MRASSQRTWQVRLALMLILGVAAAAACVVTLMWWKAPAASGQDETAPNEPSFVVKCEFSHRAQVDPIVDFGKTTSFHMHDFFGNTTTDENSTYDTLRAGGTNCDDPGDTAAYWAPTLSWTDSSGTTERTASITRFYYRLGGKSPNVPVNPHPALDTNGDGQLDDGLKIVTVQGKKVEWRCQGGTWSPTPPTQCGDNTTLVVRIFFPDCLQVDANGQPVVDSADHRSHMVDATSTGCPSTHPYPVPRLQTNFVFKASQLATKGQPTLSSGGQPSYSTMHVDFFNAWDQPKLEDLVARCINAGPFTATKPKPADCG